VKLVSEIKFFAEDHPLVESHFIALLGEVFKESSVIVALLAQPFEGLP
jgi:hypothetical protein